MSGNITLLSSWLRTGHRQSRTSRTWKVIYCAAIISTAATIFAAAAGATPLLSGLREVYRQGRNSATRDKLHGPRPVQVISGSKVHSHFILPSLRAHYRCSTRGWQVICSQKPIPFVQSAYRPGQSALLPLLRALDRPSRASRVWQALRCTTAIQAVQSPCDTGEQSLLSRARANRVDSTSTSRVWASLRCQTHNQTVQGSQEHWVSILPTHRASYRRSDSTGTWPTFHSPQTVQSISCSFDNGTPILQSPDAIYTGPGQADLYGYLALHTDIATRFTVRTDSGSGSEVSAKVHQEGKV